MMKIFCAIGLLICSLLGHAESEKGWVFPRERQTDKGRIIIHAPQIISWTNFERTEMLVALEYTPTGSDKKVFATAELHGDTEVDLDERIVTLSKTRFVEVKVAKDNSMDYSQSMQKYIEQDTFDILLDIFLVSLGHDVLGSDAPASGFNPEPPPIYVETNPAILLFVDGEPRLEPIEDTGLQVVVNANWPVLKDPESGFMLLNRSTWFSALDITGPWSMAKNSPVNIDKIDSGGSFADFRVTDPGSADSKIISIDQPSELIVIDGNPYLENIPEAKGLEFVANTQSPVFTYDGSWYFLTSGRWFVTNDPSKGRWKWQHDLPDVFQLIPPDHGMAFVRVSIAETLEARIAIVEASLPSKIVVDKSKELKLEPDFDGEPQFEKVPGTSVARARNTSYQIIEYQGVYYLCYEGAWYQADAPVGPWTPAFRVPDAIYDIPASSPSYPVTSVSVASTTPTTVIYSAVPSYSTSVYISYGVPIYGTGWYYPPYRGFYYYPWFYSYGHGSFYNPRTGMYGTRSSWHGPFGGYSYSQYRNPKTGRQGYVETAWDGDEWASYGESYNPRTATYREAERYYNDDTHRLESEKALTRGDKTIATQRELDLDDGWSTKERYTSQGGSSYTERHRQQDGSWISSGSFTTGDGRTGTIEGEIGSGQRKTKIEGSAGGGLISAGDGENRGFVGKDSEGDLYAGKNGNVYKKGDDGWQEYDRGSGSWQSRNNDFSQYNVDQQALQYRAASNTGKTTANADRLSSQTVVGGGGSFENPASTTWQANRATGQRYSSGTNQDWSHRSSQLNRDASSRQRGYNQFNQRRTYQARGRSLSGAGRMGRR